MIENAAAEIAHTPAASPSTPSEKLTTFISATSPSTVSGPPRCCRSTWWTNGSVKLSTLTPAGHEDDRRHHLPGQLVPGARSTASSTAPTSVISAAAPKIARVRPLSGTNSTAAANAPAKMARPPSSGVAVRARPRSLSSSTAPSRRASRAAAGVSAAATANATSAAKKALAYMLRRQGSQPGPTASRVAGS